MTLVTICAGMVLLSGLFYLFPRPRPGVTEEDLDRANLEWYRRRQAELKAEGYQDLEEDARLRLLEDEHRSGPAPSPSGRTFPLWVLLPLVGLCAAALYYRLGAASDVEIASRLNSMGEDTSPELMQQLIADVEARSAARPDNLYYLALLGRYYTAQQDYANARDTYNQLVQAAPEDAQMLAYAAQADYLAAGRTLTDRARLRAEQALAVDPHQRTALGMLGMALYEQGEYAAAIDYWERLLAMEPPGSESAEMIRSVVESARQRLSAAEPGELASAVATTPPEPVSAGPGVTVRVIAPADAGIAPSDTVFVLARSGTSGSRMPIAVQRFRGADLPLTVRLDDSTSMAGQKLSQETAVIVAVQVSPSGRPGEDNASWLGQAEEIVPSDRGEAVEISLRPRGS